MSVHTTSGGGVSLAAFGGGAAGSNQVIWTPDGASLVTDPDFRFDGTNAALGGAIISGRRLAIYMESSGVGWQVNGFANNQDANWLLNTPDARLLIGRMYGGTTAGTINGLNAAALAILEASNTANLLLGGTDVRTSVRQGTNQAGFVPGTIRTFPTAVGNVGAGTDLLQSAAIAAGSMSRNGQRLNFGGCVVMAANGNTKTPSLQLSGANIWTPTGTAMNGGAVIFVGYVMRIDATNGEACVFAFTAGGTTPITVGLMSRVAVTPTWANAQTLDLFGAGTADNDLTGRMYLDVFESGN